MYTPIAVTAVTDEATKDAEEGFTSATEQIVENKSCAHRRRITVGIALSLVCGALAGVFAARHNSLASRRTSKEGFRSIISKASVTCGGEPPPALNLSFVGTNPAFKCTLPTYLQGVYKKEAKINEQRGERSVMYSMAIEGAQSIFIYLDHCGYGSNNPHQSDCVVRWVVNDPTQLVTARFNNGIPTSFLRTSSCSEPARGTGPLAPMNPPVGTTMWTVHCREGTKAEVMVSLLPAKRTVTGAWTWQKCVDPAGTGTNALFPLDLTGEKGVALPDVVAIKAALTQQFQTQGYKVSKTGIPSGMVAEMTTSFLAALGKTKPGLGQALVKPVEGRSCLWLWKWTLHGFQYNDGATVKTSPTMELLDRSMPDMVMTMSPDTLPKCMPGHAVDKPFFQKCDSDDHKVPAATLTSQAQQIVTGVR